MGRCGVDSSESRHTGSSEILCNRDRNDRDRSWPAWHCARAANFAVDPRQGCNCAALRHWPPTLESGTDRSTPTFTRPARIVFRIEPPCRRRGHHAGSAGAQWSRAPWGLSRNRIAESRFQALGSIACSIASPRSRAWTPRIPLTICVMPRSTTSLASQPKFFRGAVGLPRLAERALRNVQAGSLRFDAREYYHLTPNRRSLRRSAGRTQPVSLEAQFGLMLASRITLPHFSV